MAEKITIARYKKSNKTFEIAINPEEAVDFREGKEVDIEDVIRSNDVFEDASKGLLASDEDLKEIFGTIDRDEIILTILKEGEIQLTAEQRKKLREQKEKQIIEMIHRRVVDPRTHLPHPTTRIKLAMEQAKVHIKENKSAEDQLEEIMKALKVILPMKYEEKKIAIRVPASDAGKAYSQIKQMIKTEKEEWLNDGSLRVITTIPSAIEQEIYDKLNKICHGGIETETIEVKN
jgi:ribosome maturation protein SDO1